MAILSLDEIIELRKAVMENFNVKVHAHDTCPAQFFTLDEKNQKVEDFIIEYFAEKNLKAIFKQDGLSFEVHKK